MAFVSVTPPSVGDATKQSMAEQWCDNDDALNDAVGIGAGVINGSFETGTGATAPTGWTRTTWGSAAYDTTTPAHGAQAYKFTSTGAGGGTLLSEDFIECSEYAPITLAWLLKSSAADIKNIVTLKFYDKAQSAVSDVVLYSDDTTNPASWTRFVRTCLAPATSCYMKVLLTFADSSDATSGTCTMDGVELLDHPAWFETGKTIAEQTLSSGTWTDKSSFTIDLGPLSGSSLVSLRFTAEAKYAGTAAAGQRFRVGSQYSNVHGQGIVSGTIYTVPEFTADYLYFSYTLNLSNATGVITVYQQLYEDGGSGTLYGRKLDGEISVEVLYP